MDEETLRLVLEVYDKASPGLQKATHELKKVADQAEKTQRLVNSVLTGNNPRDPHTGRFVSPASLAGASGPQMMAEAARKIRANNAEEARLRSAQLAKEKTQRDLMHASALQALAAEKRVRDAELSEEKRRRDLMHMSAVQAIKAEDRERRRAEAEEKRRRGLMHDSAMQALKAEDRLRKQHEEMQRNRNQAFGNVLGGAQGIIGGVGRIAGSVLSFGGQLLRVGGWALDFGKMVISGVVDTLHEAEKVALVTAGALAAIMAVTAKAGLEFNTFKENTLFTLEALTKSAGRASDIFKHAFQVAIPAKFTFEEVLDGFRSMEAFGIRVNNQFKNTKHTVGEIAVALAQGMDKPLQQVTRFLGNLSQGRLLLQQAAPLGLARPTLQKYGVEFDSHGSAKNREQLLAAALEAAADKWGSLLDKMSNTYEARLDSMVSLTRMFSGKITEGLFESLKGAYGKVADLMKQMIEPEALVNGVKVSADKAKAHVKEVQQELDNLRAQQQEYSGGNYSPELRSETADKIKDQEQALREAQGTFAAVKKELGPVYSLVEALKTPFDLLGEAINKAAGELPDFANWLSQVLTKDKIIDFLSEVASMVEVMYDDIKEFLDYASGGNGLVGLWENFRNFAVDAIDFVMEAWTEFTANVEFLAKTAPELWKMFLKAAAELKSLLEVIVGLMILSFGAQIVSGVAQVGKGVWDLGKGIKGIYDWLKAIGGLGGVAGALRGVGGGIAGGIARGAGAIARGAGAFADSAVGAVAVPFAVAAAGIAGGNALSEADDKRHGRSHVGFIDAVKSMNPLHNPDDDGKAESEKMIREWKARRRAAGKPTELAAGYSLGTRKGPSLVDRALDAISTRAEAAELPHAASTLGRGKASQKSVALTFDDGPHPGKTDRILDTLKKNGVKATFFVTGQQAEKHPDLIRRMAAEGHTIGNHTYSHQYLQRQTPAQVAAEYDRTSRIVQGITGKRPTLARPPGFHYRPEDLETAGRLGMTTVFGDSSVAEGGRIKNPGGMASSVIQRQRNGTINVMHDADLGTPEMVDRTIKGLRQRGYSFTTPDKMMAGGVSPSMAAPGGLSHREAAYHAAVAAKQVASQAHPITPEMFQRPVPVAGQFHPLMRPVPAAPEVHPASQSHPHGPSAWSRVGGFFHGLMTAIGNAGSPGQPGQVADHPAVKAAEATKKIAHETHQIAKETRHATAHAAGRARSSTPSEDTIDAIKGVGKQVPDHHFSGPLGFVQDIGRAALGTGAKTGEDLVPPELKDWNERRKAFVQGQMDGFHGRVQRRRDRGEKKAAWKKRFGGMTGGKMDPMADGDEDNGMPPSSIIGGRVTGDGSNVGFDSATGFYGFPVKPPDADEASAQIEAYEGRFRKMDKNDRAEARTQLLGLYHQKLSGEQGQVQTAMEEAKRTQKQTADGQLVDKDDADKKKDIIDYWKKVQATWKTEADIEDINKDAIDARTDRMKEANQARMEATEAQIALLPDSQQAAARAASEIPLLTEKQRIILGKMKQVKEGTKEHLELETEYYKTQKTINDMRADAADESAKQAFEGPKRQFGTLKRLIGMLPKGAQKGAMQALLAPRIKQAFQAAGMERDPVKRQEKLLEVADMFAELKESKKGGDPFGGVFDKAMQGERQQAIDQYRTMVGHGKGRGKHIPSATESMFNNQSRRGHMTGAEAGIFAAMSPFAPSPGGVGGGSAFSKDRYTQVILNLPANASEQQIADAIMRVLQNQMQGDLGR